MSCESFNVIIKSSSYKFEDVPSLDALHLHQRISASFGIPIPLQVLVHGDQVVTQQLLLSLQWLVSTNRLLLLFMKGTSDNDLIELCKDLELNESIENRISGRWSDINAGTTVSHLKQLNEDHTGFRKEHQLILLYNLPMEKNKKGKYAFLEHDYLIDVFFQ